MRTDVRLPGSWVAVRAALTFVVLLLVAGCATSPSRASRKQHAPPPQATVPDGSKEASEAGTAPSRPGSISAEALGIYRTRAQMFAPPSKDELAVVDSAKTLVGQPPESSVVVNGRQFTLDCIGTVAAIFYRMYIDVTRDFSRYVGDGVSRLYASLKDERVLHKDRYPRPGEIVVWDNTWDANENGDRSDDLRTHAGVVLAVDHDGTIH